MTLVPVTYKGGIYQHDIIIDLIEDLGGYIVQKHIIAAEVVLQCFVPKDDIEQIRRIAKPLFGEVTDSPLVGTEIAIVSMSLEIHHLPHPSCDIAEYVRRIGAKSNMVSLARGPGKRIAGLNDEERDVINEHDIAVYLLGNFETCIEYKIPTLRRGSRGADHPLRRPGRGDPPADHQPAGRGVRGECRAVHAQDQGVRPAGKAR